MELLSPLPLQECLERLKAAIDSPPALFGRWPVVGRVRGSALHARRRVRYANHFQTRLSAELEEQDGGTLIRCRFSIHPAVAVFTALWFGAAILIGGMIFFGSLAVLADASDGAGSGTWFGLGIPVMLLAFGAGVVALGRYLARGERDVLLAFLRETLRAQPQDGVAGRVRDGQARELGAPA